MIMKNVDPNNHQMDLIRKCSPGERAFRKPKIS